MIEVVVNRRAAARVASGHPWIFSSDVLDSSAASAGDAVKVVDPAKRALGVAHFSGASQIALRLLSSRVEEVDAAFFRRRFQAALEYRRKVVAGSGAFRLVHAEGDLLPGLIVDRYGDYLSVQTLNQGMDRAKDAIVAALVDLVSPRGVLLRNDAAVRSKESLPRETAVAHGEIPESVAIAMNGLRFEVDLVRGHKTGVYLDQRENYLAAARYSHGVALDCFTSTGGFALHLAAHCERVEGVDTSEAALDTARRNQQSNGIANLEFRHADVFDLLASYTAAGRRFSTVILDPPAFAKTRGALDGAGRGYKEINLRALRLLTSGGILVTCSCSHHFSEAGLLESVASASLDAGRTLRVLERRTQAQDHPILLTVPETHYLKCLILQVL
ncbi:MAG: class I SAM-dependent rRNA methyltransferase [Bryobacteraceae bacterium]